MPESPRWLVTHCRSREAEETVKRIEADVAKVHRSPIFRRPTAVSKFIRGRFRPRPDPDRDVKPLPLATQHSRPDAHGSAVFFLYNSVFFTFGLIIANFYHVPNEQVGLYLFSFSDQQFCGPLLLGSLFDTVGRKKMIAGTFAMSGVLCV